MTYRYTITTATATESRASGNGMAGMEGTAMAIPVFEGEKCCRLNSNLATHAL